MIETWLATTWTEAGLVVLSSVAIYAAVIVTVRLNGLRSFSKMSSFDFAVTVATGSLIATVAATTTSLANGVVALAAIMGSQRLVAAARRRTGFERLVDNTPILLMAGDRMIEEHMMQARITPDDIRAHVRAANVLDWSDVRAVVLETTGDVSVMHGGELDPSILEGVIGAELVR